MDPITTSELNFAAIVAEIIGVSEVFVFKDIIHGKINGAVLDKV